MSAPVIVGLKPLKGELFENAEVGFVRLHKGLFVCFYCALKKVGAAVLLPNVEAEGYERLLLTLRDRAVDACGGDLSLMTVKLIAVKISPDRTKKVSDLLGVSVAGVAHQDVGAEAYFYSDSGRVRLAELSAEIVSGPELSDNHEALRRRKRVLVVDDSKTIRQLLTKLLSSDSELEVVGAAECPSQAEKMIAELKPDVITLDINMPEMDGVTFLKKYLPRYPIPTVMISAISMEEGNLVLTALELGAVDYIQKPSFEEIDRMAPVIVEKVKTAATIKVKGPSAAEPVRKRLQQAGAINRNLIVAVGSSTGGTEALRYFFSKLPAEIPPILVVQHIPPVFSKAFANRLSELCPFAVKEAEDGDTVEQNKVLIAPGGTQMEIVSGGPSGYRVRVFDGLPVNRHKPSVDVLFDSVAKEIGKRAIGIIMTGMGKDGAAGMLRMKKAGARTIAQDEASCVVFGMPKEAIKLGAADTVENLDRIPEVLTSWVFQAKN